MLLYKKLSLDTFIFFYHEMMKNMDRGLLTKNMYDELRIIIFVEKQRGMTLEKPSDFEEFVDQSNKIEDLSLTSR